MTTPEVIDIDPNGDVVLVCGSEQDEVRLRVSSAVLTRASTVFRALLSPRFKEGIELEENKSVEVPLPDDSGDILRVICNATHNRNDAVPESLSTPHVCAVAALTDKYDCAVAMKYMGRIWIQPHTRTASASELKKLLKATLFFNDEYLFKAVCKSIVWRSVGRITVSEELRAAGLKGALDELDRERRDVMDFITEAIDIRINNFASLACPKQKCNLSSIVLTQFINLLTKRGLYGSPRREKRSIEQLQHSLRTFECSLNSLSVPAPCGMNICREVAKNGDDWLNFGSDLESLDSDFEFPCFRCVRAGTADNATKCEHDEASQGLAKLRRSW